MRQPAFADTSTAIDSATLRAPQEVNLQVELVSRGVSSGAAAQYLDSGPTMAFSVYYGARSDCGAEAQARLDVASSCAGGCLRRGVMHPGIQQNVFLMRRWACEELLLSPTRHH